MSKELLYFCKRCQSAKPSKIVTIFPNIKSGDDKTKQDVEVIKEFETTVSDGQTSERKTFKARQLECNHYVSFYTPGFKDTPNEGLDEIETREIRRKIEMEITGKQSKELEQIILFHCEQYQTLLKISSKQLKQAKYAIQFLDQLREKYSALLSNEDDKKTFEQKFANFLDLRPTTPKTIEREKKSTESAVDKQKIALEAFRQSLKKSGYDAKDLFGKKKEENLNSESESI